MWAEEGEASAPCRQGPPGGQQGVGWGGGGVKSVCLLVYLLSALGDLACLFW